MAETQTETSVSDFRNCETVFALLKTYTIAEAPNETGVSECFGKRNGLDYVKGSVNGSKPYGNRVKRFSGFRNGAKREKMAESLMETSVSGLLSVSLRAKREKKPKR